MSYTKERRRIRRSIKNSGLRNSYYSNQRRDRRIIDTAIKKVFNEVELLKILPMITRPDSDMSEKSFVNRHRDTNQYTNSKVVDDLLYIREVVIKALTNLLNVREHLLLQLNLSCGNITEEYFDMEESKYLTSLEKQSTDELKKEIETLCKFTGMKLNLFDIADSLHCSVDDATHILPL